MASQTMTLSYLLCFNIMFFTLVSANYKVVPCPPPPSPPSCKWCGGGSPTPKTPPSPVTTPITPPSPVTTPITPPSPSHPIGGPITPITPPSPISTPTTPPIMTPPGGDKCPIDVLKLAACANVLNGVLGAVLGAPQSQCCTLLSGLTDLNAAICLCTAIKANVLGNNIDVQVSLSVLLNFCNKAGDASKFQCS